MIKKSIVLKRYKMVVLCALIIMIVASSSSAHAKSGYWGQLGSAKFIGGRTLVISIFANDAHTQWDFPAHGKEKALCDKIYERMHIGLEWLEKQTERYGVHSEFIYDFREIQDGHPICYFADFEEDLTSYSNEGYYAIQKYILNHIYPDEIASYYEADNVVFAIHLNAPSSEEYRSYAIAGDDMQINDDQVLYETAVYVPYGHNRENTPAVYAHEILHLFGAKDLYYANKGVPQSYVDYLSKNRIYELMNHCYFSAYDRVTTPFSDVDAYFVGLISTCDDVVRFGLGPSSFEK